MRVHTGSGNVSLAGDLSAARDVKIGSSSGDVTLSLSTSFPLRVDATTGSGSLVVDLPGMKTLHRNDHELTAEVGAGGPAFRIDTSSGDVRVDGR
jgi:DUF4097 and DUF4098 domain-containing protein YvlB